MLHMYKSKQRKGIILVHLSILQSLLEFCLFVLSKTCLQRCKLFSENLKVELCNLLWEDLKNQYNMIELLSRVGTLKRLNWLKIFRYRKVLLRPESNSIKSKSTSILLDLTLSKSGKAGADFIEGRAYWGGLINIRIISYRGNKEQVLTNLINF